MERKFKTLLKVKIIYIIILFHIVIINEIKFERLSAKSTFEETVKR